jgi:hypothetical protein
MYGVACSLVAVVCDDVLLIVIITDVVGLLEQGPELRLELLAVEHVVLRLLELGRLQACRATQRRERERERTYKPQRVSATKHIM